MVNLIVGGGDTAHGKPPLLASRQQGTKITDESLWLMFYQPVRNREDIFISENTRFYDGTVAAKAI